MTAGALTPQPAAKQHVDIAVGHWEQIPLVPMKMVWQTLVSTVSLSKMMYCECHHLLFWCFHLVLPWMRQRCAFV